MQPNGGSFSALLLVPLGASAAKLSCGEEKDTAAGELVAAPEDQTGIKGENRQMKT
jgi:hypothetical protein